LRATEKIEEEWNMAMNQIGASAARHVGLTWRGIALLAALGCTSLALGSDSALGVASASRPGVPIVLAQAAPAAKAASKSTVSVQAELDALIKAARAEGELIFYSTATENIAKRIANAYTSKYGVKVSFTRLGGSTQLLQRYAADAESGAFAADMVFNAGGTGPFAEDALKKGWIDAVLDAGIPAVRSGEYPIHFNRGGSAIIQIAPWMLAYNSEKVKGADIPRDWPDLLKPAFKGQILVPNPASSVAYLDFWTLAIDKYGEKFFEQLRAQNLRGYPSGVPAVQALGAGEGAIAIPVVPALVEATRAKGAPLGISVIELTSGVEMQFMLTARAKAKHPNAARLMAHYVMTREGNAVFNDDPGGMTIYDTSKLPKLYQSPKPATMGRAAEVAKLLGF